MEAWSLSSHSVVHLVAQAHRSEKAPTFSAPYKDTARACPENASIVAVTISTVIVSKTVFLRACKETRWQTD
jgi:hypothetical protein